MTEDKRTETKNVAKGTILLRPGDICIAAYQIKSGCLRSYVIDPSGKEHILHFASERWLISDFESYIHRSPSKLFIDAIEDSEVIIINNDPTKILEEINKETIIGIAAKFRNHVIVLNNRLISLLVNSSEERYLEFVERYPELKNRIPQRMIASYLGITPEHLSYVKGQLVRRP